MSTSSEGVGPAIDRYTELKGQFGDVVRRLDQQEVDPVAALELTAHGVDQILEMRRILGHVSEGIERLMERLDESA